MVPISAHQLAEVAEIIIKKVDKNIKLKHLLDKPVGDIGRSANYEKAYKLLNWEPQISLYDGISDLLEWLKKKLAIKNFLKYF